MFPPLLSHILLADDDPDDCLLFTEVLLELALPINLTCVHNGERLMHYLNRGEAMPQILFLDVNMPRKNGLECLKEIRASAALKNLYVIVLSTSLEKEMMNQLYENGAQQCFRKPNTFSELKHLILTAITTAQQPKNKEAAAEKKALNI